MNLDPGMAVHGYGRVYSNMQMDIFCTVGKTSVEANFFGGHMGFNKELDCFLKTNR